MKAQSLHGHLYNNVCDAQFNYEFFRFVICIARSLVTTSQFYLHFLI